MPTYGYRCPSCGAEFDVWQRMSDAAGASCPACGAAANRVFFAPAIVFNGSGFYKTDSRAKQGASGAKGSGTSGTKSAKEPVSTAPGAESGSSPSGGAASAD